MIIEAKNITKKYANHTALDNISLEISRGTIYGLLGPNGAGKSTLIRIMNRITMPDTGELLFNGKPIQHNDIAKIGYLPEERGLYKKMKVAEQALYLSRLKGMTKNDAMIALKHWFEKFEITQWWDKKVEELSKGMAQKVQFIITVIHNPQLLIFDEPFSGFDPVNAQLLKNEIKEQAKNGTTIVFSTHNMASVEEICQHITLINKSQNVLSGTVDQIRQNYADNSYSIDFNGDAMNLKHEIEKLKIGEITELENHKMTVKLPKNNTPQKLIECVNQTVNIHNIKQNLPTMNDIFIEMVGEKQ